MKWSSHRLKWYELVVIMVLVYTVAIIVVNLLLWTLFGKNGVEV